MNRTGAQIDGDESKHNPSVGDAINGFLTDATTDSRQAGQLYAPLPNEDNMRTKQRAIIQQMDSAKKAWRRARQ